jgi:phosphoglycolate phosphatase
MAPIPVRAVLLDLDGTLLDTAPDLLEAANGMLRDLGQPQIDEATVRAYVGRGIANLVKRLLAGRLDAADDQEPPPAEAMANFRQHYAVSNGCHTKLFPGVREGLEALRARGLPLACVTNKAEVFTLPLLERMGLAGFFQVVVSGDTLPRAKPDPMQLVWVCGRFDLKPKDMLFIGDSVNDVKAARAAGCPVFVVPYGYNEGRGVRGLDSDAIVASIEEAAVLISNA